MVSRRRYSVLSAVGVMAFGVVAGAQGQVAHPPTKPVTTTRAADIIGKSFPDVPLRNLTSTNEEKVSLASYKGDKIVVGIFMANRCGATWVYDKKIAQLVSDYAPKGVTVVAIHSNYEENDDEIRKQMTEHQLALPVLDDKPNQTLAKYIGAHATPTFFIVDKAGVLRYIGAFDRFMRQPAYLRPVLDALLTDKKLPYTRTNAAGCSLAYRPTVRAKS